MTPQSPEHPHISTGLSPISLDPSSIDLHILDPRLNEYSLEGEAQRSELKEPLLHDGLHLPSGTDARGLDSLQVDAQGC